MKVLKTIIKIILKAIAIILGVCMVAIFGMMLYRRVHEERQDARER